jgi:MFS family permease
MDSIERHEHNWLRRLIDQGRSLAALLPMMTAVFIAYLVIGLAMPVLPLHVHQGLGLGTFVVGLVAGSQFAASLISRLWAGHQADTRGAKYALVAGLLAAAASGLLYFLSLRFVASPVTSVTILLLGRALLGGAESFIVLGAFNWGLALAGPQNTGMVMAQIGTAMYLAFAVGAPAGSVLYAGYGFAAIALATTLIPVVTLLLVAPLRGVVPTPRARASFTRVISVVWVPGLGLAFSSVGFGAITTFIVLLFAQRGWGQAWLALTVLSVAFSAGRLVFGHLPDRIGGAKVALVCVLIEAAGQALIWLAPWSAAALVGAALTGLGYSLVYPGFGVEAVRLAPPQSRGLAIGAYTACLDLALGLANPALGVVAHKSGLSAVFLVSTLVVLCAAAIGVRLLYARRRSDISLGGLRGSKPGARSTKMKEMAARLALCGAVIVARLIYAPSLSDGQGQVTAANVRFGQVIETKSYVDHLNAVLPSLHDGSMPTRFFGSVGSTVSTTSGRKSVASSVIAKIQDEPCPWKQRARAFSHQST